MDTDKIYQRIGEFVVSYQWVEDKFRQIGWLILDPKRIDWPPKSLRNESSKDLIDKVAALYLDLIERLGPADRESKGRDFKSIVAGCHEMRKYRNNLLHSAFIEFKAGGEVVGLLRSNPKIKVDESSGDVLFDQEDLTEDAILEQIHKLADLAFPLGQHYMQLIAWCPFDSPVKPIAM